MTGRTAETNGVGRIKGQTGRGKTGEGERGEVHTIEQTNERTINNFFYALKKPVMPCYDVTIITHMT